jgi:hypothetical protein
MSSQGGVVSCGRRECSEDRLRGDQHVISCKNNCNVKANCIKDMTGKKRGKECTLRVPAFDSGAWS